MLWHNRERKTMKTDAQLKADVSNELQWDPAINAAYVGWRPRMAW